MTQATILILGGTTEGRLAAQVLDEAGSPFLYSTRSDGQALDMQHGIRLTGALTPPLMEQCCRERGVALVVDATHPFAEGVHRSVVELCRRLRLPLVRFERRFPPRPAGVVWCRSVDDAVAQLSARGVERLLALTGVNTIGRLRPFWQHHECWCRILDREESRRAARDAGFPEQRLVYYEHDDTEALLQRLRPQALLTKESGESGGFEDKVAAAQRQGVQVYAVERPAYPGTPDAVVDGPHGLRRAVERLLPPFFPLHSGLTTGTCATAAAVADATRLLRGEQPELVPVVLPNGETIRVPVTYHEGYAACVKEAGDDPDVTNHLEVRASVSRAERFTVEGGEGVGVITLPGFDSPPGSPAINRGPRQMLLRNLQPFATPLRVIVSAPQGKALASRTFNPRLGIVGGISIIGVSGIVKPFSEDAFLDSIRKCLTIARASGSPRVVINSGAKSERFLRSLYPQLPAQAFVEYGNYVGHTLRMASEMGIERVTLGVMLGKAVKLAAGHTDTHSRRATMDKDFIAEMLDEAGCHVDLGPLTLARELWTKIPEERLTDFSRVVIGRCAAVCQPLLAGGELTVLLIDDDGRVYS